MIDAVCLNRKGLFEDRKQHWDLIENAKRALIRRMKRLGREICKIDIRGHEELLKEKVDVKSPFSTMVNDNYFYFTIPE